MGKERDRGKAESVSVLYAVVEEQTELGFMDAVLKPHLAQFGVYLYAQAVTTRTPWRMDYDDD